MEATKVFTLTLAVGVKLIPFGFTRKRIPFADKLPAITEASGPVTLDNTDAEEFGWMKFTVSFCAILNDVKLTIALSLAVIFIVVALGVSIDTVPLSTLEPCGSANAKEALIAAITNVIRIRFNVFILV